MIKIVRIIARLNIGGPAINAVLLSEGLNKNGFRTTLVTGSLEKGEGNMSYLAYERAVRLVFIPELNRRLCPLKDLKAAWKIYKLIRRERPDIVHTHTAKAGALGRISAILAGVPIKVHTFHGHIFEGYFGRIRTKAFVMIERFLAKWTDKIIVVSDSIANDIITKYNIALKDKLRVIHLGFDLGHFFDSDSRKGNFKKELKLADGTFLIGIVGRLVPIKNHQMFLDVVKLLSAKRSPLGEAEGYPLNAKFIIVGDGQLRRELENYAKQLGIKDKVIFLGWRRDLENIYADLDIVCLTSLNEGTPVSLIEAMASAKPVVAVDVGGVRDIVEDNVNGRLAPSGGAEMFSKAVSDLLQDENKRNRLGAQGREFVRQNFNKDRLIKDMERLYKDLLKKKGK